MSESNEYILLSEITSVKKVDECVKDKKKSDRKQSFSDTLLYWASSAVVSAADWFN